MHTAACAIVHADPVRDAHAAAYCNGDHDADAKADDTATYGQPDCIANGHSHAHTGRYAYTNKRTPDGQASNGHCVAYGNAHSRTADSHAQAPTAYAFTPA